VEKLNDFLSVLEESVNFILVNFPASNGSARQLWVNWVPLLLLLLLQC
jgi:hypothetical protein